MNDNQIKIPLLTAEDIEVKIKQVTKSGALALLYKTARVDRRVLNEVFGPINWTSDFKVIDDTLYCGIGIRTSTDQDFVYKWDAGGESENPLDDGAKAKANASDAFKRAGFAVGIGEELYSSPQIWLDVNTVQDGNKWVLQDRYAKYVVTRIEYNEKTRVITGLDICNARSNIKVFSWDMPTTGAIAKKMVNTLSAEESTPGSTSRGGQEAPKSPDTGVKNASESNSSLAETKPLKTLISEIGKMVKNMYASEGSADSYNAIVHEIVGDTPFKCNAATEDQYDTVLAIYNKLVSGGYNG